MHVDELCRDIQETHVYKVCVWQSRTKKNTYVFIGRNPGITKVLLDKVKKGKALEDKDTATLRAAFGQNWKNKLAWQQGAEYIGETIYRDDNVSMVKKKIATYLGLEEQDLYAWIEREVSLQNPVWRYGLATHLCRGGDKSVSAAEVTESLGHLLGRIPSPTLTDSVSVESVASFIKKLGITHILQPLELKRLDAGYMYFGPVVPFGVERTSKLDMVENVYDSSKLLETFRVRHNTINVALRDAVPEEAIGYFYRAKVATPAAAADEVIKATDGVCAEVSAFAPKASQFNMECRVGFMHLRCNEGASTGVEPTLDEVFKRIHASQELPFLKFINALGNKTYRMHNEAIKTIPQSDIDTWVELVKPRHPVAVRESITFKVPYSVGASSSAAPSSSAAVPSNTKFATVILYPDYHVDVKFHSHKSLDNNFEDIVTKGLAAVNSLLQRIKEAVPELGVSFGSIERNFWLRTDTNVKVVNLVTSATVECKTNNPSIRHIRDLAGELFPYLAVEELPTEGPDTLVLSYKRIDNYSSLSNVVKFLNRNHALDDIVLVEKLQANFFMSPEGARSEVDKWRSVAKKAAANQIGWQFYLRPKDATGATIKLRKAGVAYKVVTDGVTDVVYQKRFNKLVKFLLGNAGKGKQFDAKVAKDYDALVHIAAEDGEDDDALTLGDLDSEALLEDTYDEFDLGDVNFDDVVEDQPEPDPKKSTNAAADDTQKEPSVEDTTDRSRYVLERLKYADPNLFGEASYSRKCQQVDKRQPIVITEEEKRHIDAVSQGSYTNFIDYGYNPKSKSRNIYICPEIWCPLSKISMTYEQFVEKGSVCPGLAEPVIDLRADYWTDSKGKIKPRYVGFYGMNQECLPCCFLKGPKANNPHQQKIAKCMGSDTSRKSAEVVGVRTLETQSTEDSEKASARYILGTQYPLEPGRLGLVPNPVAAFFGDKHCGSGSKATGFITEETSCFARRGIPATSTQDFLVAGVEYLLGKKNLLASIKTQLTVAQFLTLNGGRLCSSFIDETKTLRDPQHYSKFRAWILTNKMYVSAFNLYSLREHMLGAMTFDQSKPVHKDMLREFLIYNAFQNFLAYLEDPAVPKQDSVLLDLFNREQLNPKGINIVVVESDSSDAYVVCAHDAANLRPHKPYAFLVKQGGHFYEPLVHVTHAGQQSQFVAEDSPTIAALIDAYESGSGNDGQTKLKGADARTLRAYLMAMKKKVRFQVLNYDFSLHGFVLQGGLFVPVRKQPPILEKNATFIFVSELRKYVKDTEDWEEAAEMFKTLHDLTKDNAYKIKKVLYETAEGKKAKAVLAFVMQEDIVVPLQTKRIPEESYLDNLNLFIGFEEDDTRKVFINNEEHREVLFSILKSEVLGALQNDPGVVDTARRMRDLQQRGKLEDLVRDLVKRFALAQKDAPADTSSLPSKPCSGLRKNNCSGVCTWTLGRCMLQVPEQDIDLFIGKIIDAILRTKARAPANRRLKQRVNAAASEVVFTQEEVADGKASELMLSVRNPHAYLDNVVTEFVADTLHTVTKKNVLSEEWRTMPYPFNKEMKTFRINTPAAQSPQYLLDIFAQVNHLKNARAVVDYNTVLKLVENRLALEWSSRGHTEILAELKLYNPSFASLSKSKRAPAMSDMLQVFQDPEYWPSEFEVLILANLLRVNVTIFARKTLRNPNGVKCIKPNVASKDYVFLFQTTITGHDVYSVITKDENNNFVMSEKEIGEVLHGIKESCRQYYLEAI